MQQKSTSLCHYFSCSTSPSSTSCSAVDCFAFSSDLRLYSSSSSSSVCLSVCLSSSMTLLPYSPVAHSRSLRKGSKANRKRRGPEAIDFFIWTVEVFNTIYSSISAFYLIHFFFFSAFFNSSPLVVTAIPSFSSHRPFSHFSSSICSVLFIALSVFLIRCLCSTFFFLFLVLVRELLATGK